MQHGSWQYGSSGFEPQSALHSDHQSQAPSGNSRTQSSVTRVTVFVPPSTALVRKMSMHSTQSSFPVCTM